MNTPLAKSVIVTKGLTKSYGSFDALTHCDLAIPNHSIVALVGSNGAGKTSLLKILAGVSKPTNGSVSINQQTPALEADYVRNIGYLAQNIPLYKDLRVSDHVTMAESLNDTFDTKAVISRLKTLGIPLNRKAGVLSGGQRAQLGLALALAKKPKLLLLDEPVAALDPLARRDFLALLAEAVAEGDVSVVMSSHLLNDLERVCDWVVIMQNGQVQLSAAIDEVVASHWRITGKAANAPKLPKTCKIIYQEKFGEQLMAIVRGTIPKAFKHNWIVAPLSMEDITLAYMQQRTKEEVA